MYEGYKGQRQACPDAVKEAVPRLQHLLRAMGVPVISVSVGGRLGASPPSCGLPYVSESLLMQHCAFA